MAWYTEGRFSVGVDVIFRNVFVFLTIFLLTGVAYAQPKRVAVLEFRGVGIENHILAQISDEARGGVREGLPREKYTITSRENIKQILEDMGKTLESCSDECEITLGRDVGADYVLSGGLFLMEGVYILTLKLHDTHSGSLLAQKRIQEKSVITLLQKTNESTKNLAEEDIAGVALTQSSDRVSVTFDSIPSGKGVTVQVGGTLICTETPCTEKVPVGTHQVRIQKKRYFAWTTDQYMEAGGRIEANLKATFALLSVNTSPRGLDIHFQKDAPVESISQKELPPDTYTIWVKDRCFVDEGMEINLEAGVDELLTFRPKSKASGVDVEVYDAQKNAVPAKIYIDNRLVGEAPFRGAVALCSKKLRAEYEGKQREISLSLREHRVSEVHVQLSE